MSDNKQNPIDWLIAKLSYYLPEVEYYEDDIQQAKQMFSEEIESLNRVNEINIGFIKERASKIDSLERIVIAKEKKIQELNNDNVRYKDVCSKQEKTIAFLRKQNIQDS